MAARTASRALTRMRRKSVASSASNIEPLPGEGDEGVFERGADGGEAAHADAGQYQLAVAVLGAVAVEASEDEQLSGAQEGEGEAEALAHAEGVGLHLLVGDGS